MRRTQHAGKQNTQRPVFVPQEGNPPQLVPGNGAEATDLADRACKNSVCPLEEINLLGEQGGLCYVCLADRACLTRELHHCIDLLP